MSFFEYPKMLFKGEAFVIVDDADEEKAQRAQGWHEYGKDPLDHDGDGRKGGSKAKAKAKAAK